MRSVMRPEEGCRETSLATCRLKASAQIYDEAAMIVQGRCLLFHDQHKRSISVPSVFYSRRGPAILPLSAS